MKPIPLSAEQKARLREETDAAVAAKKRDYQREYQRRPEVAAKKREYQREYQRRQAIKLAEFRKWKKEQWR